MEYEWYFSIDSYDFALSYLRWIFSQVSGSTHDSRSYKNSFEYTVKRRIQERRVSCRYIYMLNSISRISSISVCSPHSLALLCSFSKTSTSQNSIRSGQIVEGKCSWLLGRNVFLPRWEIPLIGNTRNLKVLVIGHQQHKRHSTSHYFGRIDEGV